MPNATVRAADTGLPTNDHDDAHYRQAFSDLESPIRDLYRAAFVLAEISENYFSGMRVTLSDGIVTMKITGEQLEAALFLAYDVHSRARALKSAYYAAAGEA